MGSSLGFLICVARSHKVPKQLEVDSFTNDNYQCLLVTTMVFHTKTSRRSLASAQSPRLPLLPSLPVPSLSAPAWANANQKRSRMEPKLFWPLKRSLLWAGNQKRQEDSEDWLLLKSEGKSAVEIDNHSWFCAACCEILLGSSLYCCVFKIVRLVKACNQITNATQKTDKIVT